MYMLTIADQTRLFLLALGLGFLLGIVYDLFRVVRMAFTMRRVGVFIQDVLFFLTCAAATFLFLLAVNQGEIRGFIIAGEGLGFLIYYFSFGLLIRSRWIPQPRVTFPSFPDPASRQTASWTTTPSFNLRRYSERESAQ